MIAIGVSLPFRRVDRVLTAALALLLAAGLATTAVSMAWFRDADSSAAALAADTLAPPTSLGATGSLTATLSWTMTVDAYAAGYHVYRAATSSGVYALIGTVTPRTAVTFVDGPAAGTYWYKVRSYVQGWESVDAGPVSAVVVAQVATGYKPCVAASNAADVASAGDNNGYQSNPTRACTDDSSFATDSNSGSGGTQSCGAGAVPDVTKDRHRLWGYALGLPATVTSIDGIQVRADLALNNVTGTTNLCAQLSWDAGTTWTTIKSQAITVAGETTYVFGGTADTWGRAWTTAQLGTATFRVRIIDASTLASKQFQLDYVAVQVTYTP